MKNTTEKVKEFLDDHEFKYNFKNNMFHLGLTLGTDDSKDMRGEDLNFIFEPNDKLNIVRIIMLIDGTFTKTNTLMDKINEINSNLELGNLIALDLKDNEGEVKLICRHVFILGNSNKLMNKKQFELLFTYMHFVQFITFKELGVN
ncbi:hypothetical protein ACIQ34_13575 [Ureibacillus sp. NPDC094379]